MNSLLITILTVVTLTDAVVYFVSDKRHKRQATPTVPTTTSQPLPTNMVVTTPRLGCKHESKRYNPGQEIYRGRSDNWCYAAYCGNDGHIIYADDFNCVTTTTTPATTKPRTTIPNGCLYEGKWYGPGQEVYRGHSGNWCYFAYCEYGHVQHADNFNCNPTTLPPTTTPKPTPPTTIPSGCMFEGKWYKPGQIIYNRQTGSWCYSAYCDYNGQILYGDNFNCVTSHSTVPTTSANTAPLIHVG